MNLIARLWLRYKRWRNRPAFPVYRREGGYQAWKEKNPPKQDSWWDVLAIVLAIVVMAGCAGAVFFAVTFVQRSAAESAEVTTEPEATEEPPAAEVIRIEVTAEATAESEITEEPIPTLPRQTTRQWNEQTRAAIQATIDYIVTQTAAAVTPTHTPYIVTYRTPNGGNGGVIWFGDGGSYPPGFVPPVLGTLPPPPYVEPTSTPEMTEEPETTDEPESTDEPETTDEPPAIPTGEGGTPIDITPTESGEVVPSDTPTETGTSTPTYTATAIPTETFTPTPTATLTLIPRFTWQIDPLNPLIVAFENQTMPSIGVVFEWDFESDGLIDSVEIDPAITFEEAGEYLVTLYAVRGDERAEYSALVVIE